MIRKMFVMNKKWTGYSYLMENPLLSEIYRNSTKGLIIVGENFQMHFWNLYCIVFFSTMRKLVPSRSLFYFQPDCNGKLCLANGKNTRYVEILDISTLFNGHNHNHKRCSTTQLKCWNTKIFFITCVFVQWVE